MTTPALNLDELRTTIGLHPATLRHLLKTLAEDQIPPDPTVIRGILSLHSPKGLGLAFRAAYDVYFHTVALSHNTSTQDHPLTPGLLPASVTFGKDLTRLTVHHHRTLNEHRRKVQVYDRTPVVVHVDLDAAHQELLLANARPEHPREPEVSSRKGRAIRRR